VKRKKKTHLNVWFVLSKTVWVHPKTAKTVSSTTGAFGGAGSLRPWIGHSATHLPHQNPPRLMAIDRLA